MSDDIDRANDLAELERNQAIRDALRQEGPVYTGMCGNCCEPLEHGLYCSRECREDKERRDRMKT